MIENDNIEKEMARSYYDGLMDGVSKFAWWKDGVQYVGTTGKTLKDALEEIRSERKNELRLF